VNIDICVATAAVAWLPGAALLRLAGSPRLADRATKIAIQLAVGLAFWPVAVLWSSLLSLHWSALAVRCVVGVSAAVAFFPRGRVRFVRPVTFHGVLLLAIVGVTAWTRIRTITAIVLPPWVDSVHHTMLVRLFLMRGTVPATYDPFIPGAAAFYHWGFHAFAAATNWLLGATDPFAVAANVLSIGQFLNVLAPLFVYAAALALTRSRSAAVIAAALAGLVSYYPAYYVSWGRFTHLAGILLLLAWIALACSAGGRRRPFMHALLLAMIAAGLALVHVRLAFFAVTFTAVLLIRRKTRMALLAAGAMAFVLVLPWLHSMRKVAPNALAPGESDARWSTPAEVRSNLLWVPHAAELLSGATAGVSGMAGVGPLTPVERVISFVWWAAIIALATLRKKRPRVLLVVYAVLAAWCAVTMLLLNATRLQFATNTSAAITMFIPVCIAAGALVAWCVRRRVGVAIVVIACCAFGIAKLGRVINPSTVIASPADVDALQWMRRTLPAGATVIGRVQPWYGGAFIGVDGAYWTSVLTDRRSIPPPSLYGWSGRFGEMELFLARWRDEYPAVTRSTRDEARKLGVTHAYFSKGDAAPFGSVVYAKGGVTIVDISGEPSVRAADDIFPTRAAAATTDVPARRTPRSGRHS
jgi:hypothetical protein